MHIVIYINLYPHDDDHLLLLLLGITKTTKQGYRFHSNDRGAVDCRFGIDLMLRPRELDLI